MNFRTTQTFPPSAYPIDHHSKILAVGSCFSEHIGNRLKEGLFPARINPLGTIYNPIGLAAQIERALDNLSFTQEEFFEKDQLWPHFLLHSSLAEDSHESSLSTANKHLARLRDSLLSSTHLFITLGTAWVYRLKSSGEFVAHNHRLPASDFEKILLAPEQSAEALDKTFEALRALNPQITIVLTISPVRHTRDGLHENNLSKSSLFLTANLLREKYPDIEYFPAFELINDDLRDYRFFEADLVHPNQQAIDYVWQTFQDTYFSPETKQTCQKIKSVHDTLRHEPRHPKGDAYRDLLQRIERDIRIISAQGIDASPLSLLLDARHALL